MATGMTDDLQDQEEEGYADQDSRGDKEAAVVSDRKRLDQAVRHFDHVGVAGAHGPRVRQGTRSLDVLELLTANVCMCVIQETELRRGRRARISAWSSG